MIWHPTQQSSKLATATAFLPISGLSECAPTFTFTLYSSDSLLFIFRYEDAIFGSQAWAGYPVLKDIPYFEGLPYGRRILAFFFSYVYIHRSASIIACYLIFDSGFISMAC